MTPFVTCCPQPGKDKSRVVLKAFAAGAAASGHSGVWSFGARAFYGLKGIEHLLRETRLAGRDWYYGDNAYFDHRRAHFFRFTRNAFQVTNPTAPPDHARRKSLGIEPRPWRKDGKHIVVVEQSPHFLQLSDAPGGANWTTRTVQELRKHTEREIRLRKWASDKPGLAVSLQRDLIDAWALVTHMSAAANEAVVAGVPVFASGPCAALAFAGGTLDKIESPRMDGDREDWAARLVGHQWTLDEIRAGRTWRRLHG